MVIRGRDFLQERGQLSARLSPWTCLPGCTGLACGHFSAALLPMTLPPSLEMCPGPPTTTSLSCFQFPLASSSLCRWRVSCNLENFMLFFFFKAVSPLNRENSGISAF
ncbi:unnamed protein product [Pipistrellus nathusii]|uniref:Uncharacterized protein n=1 Tax=Pipistrellus nathusii TaxID=59473 RepID=A0ABN9ZH04_PIPNA